MVGAGAPLPLKRTSYPRSVGVVDKLHGNEHGEQNEETQVLCPAWASVAHVSFFFKLMVLFVFKA